MASENFDPPPTPPKKVAKTFPKRRLFPLIVKSPWYIIVVSRFAQTILIPPLVSEKWMQLGKKLTLKFFIIIDPDIGSCHYFEVLHCNYNGAIGPKMRFGHNF